uniref:3CxxC-type domain-containing protein n=1 Tax=Phasianus colchicus TaxID=9054 RepID=A0A669PTF8_PHACC
MVSLPWHSRVASSGVRLSPNSSQDQAPFKHLSLFSQKLDLGHCHFPTLCWTMTTWQRIFAEKAANMKVMDPWTFQEDNNLQVHSLKPGWTEFLQNRVSGRFQCSQCLYKWSSAKVHILFHMCYGMVLMRIFRQACRQCHDPQLEEPIFSLENIERLLHNVVLKILEDFYNVPMQSADLLEVVVDGCRASGPHDRTHCEGCKLGVMSHVSSTRDLEITPDLKGEGCVIAFFTAVRLPCLFIHITGRILVIYIYICKNNKKTLCSAGTPWALPP